MTMRSADTTLSESGYRKSGAFTFAMIFAGESFLRALNVSVIPLQAYDLLGSSQRVSMVSTFVSLLVLMTTLSLPFLFARFQRRWIYTFGVSLMIAAALLFAANMVVGQVAALYLRNAGAAVLNIALQLYIMDNIPRTELTRSEPMRMAVSTISWVIGPATGAWLYMHYGPWGPQLAVIVAGVLHYAGYRLAGLREPVRREAAVSNPLRNLLDYVAQPRLRLAWSIAFGRSCYWSALFIYGPLLMVEGGLSKSSAGLLLSASQLVLPLSIVYGHAAKRWGVRPVIAACFTVMTFAMLAAGLFGKSQPYAAAGCLLLGAVFTTGLDGVGGIPFLRAVRPSQRQRFTSVYRTFIECAELLPGFVFMLLLLYFDIGIVFIAVSGLMLFLASLTWRHLPKSM